MIRLWSNVQRAMDSALWEDCVAAGVDLVCVVVSIPIGLLGAGVLFVRSIARSFSGRP